MINWTLIQYLRKINSNQIPPDKLDRYLRKYYDLIEAINHPELYMNCVSWKKFVDKCRGII